jgi:hypothetical protein
VLSEVPSKDTKRQYGGSGPNILSLDGLLQDVLATPATANTKQVEVPIQAGVEEKLHNIKQYRRAKGLCFKCGAKWSPGHQCSTIVSLNLVEELWQLLSDDEDPSSNEIARLNTDSGEDLMELSLVVVQGIACVQSVLMEGKIN